MDFNIEMGRRVEFEGCVCCVCGRGVGVCLLNFEAWLLHCCGELRCFDVVSCSRFVREGCDGGGEG